MKWVLRLVIASFSTAVFAYAAESAASIENKNIRVEYNNGLHSRIVAVFEGKAIPLGEFQPSEWVTLAGGAPVQDFAISGHRVESIRDERGRGRRLTITASGSGLQKRLLVTVYNELPRMA